MKIDGKITFLINYDHTLIELYDADSHVTFCSIRITPDQLSQALSRLGMTPCEIDIHQMDKLGKSQITKKLVFEIPKEMYWNTRDNTDKLWAMAQSILNEEGEFWKADYYFGSQDSTFYDNDTDKYYARAFCRKWINKETNTQTV